MASGNFLDFKIFFAISFTPSHGLWHILISPSASAFLVRSWAQVCGSSGLASEQTLLPSPASPSAVIVSPESLSHHSHQSPHHSPHHSHHSSPVRHPRSTSRATTSSVRPPHPLTTSYSG
ncbi:unnamed protein product, partial [Nesidiocoris tenuis]